MNMLNKNLIRRRMRIFLLLTLYIGFCFEAAAFPPDVMAVGELHELDWGYSIIVRQADIEGKKAWFALDKEGREVDEVVVSSGDQFSLDDGEIFHFEATLDSLFRSDDTNMVELTDYDWWLREEPVSTPEEEPTPAAVETIPTPRKSEIEEILILSSVTIVLGFGIFITISLKKRIDRQKIEEYRAKMREWEKDGYDVSKLKEVLRDEKRF